MTMHTYIIDGTRYSTLVKNRLGADLLGYWRFAGVNAQNELNDPSVSAVTGVTNWYWSDALSTVNDGPMGYEAQVSLVLSGVDVHKANSPQLFSTNQTWMGWFKIDPTVPQFNDILNAMSGTSGIVIEADNTGGITIVTRSASVDTTRTIPAVAIPANQWMHLALTRAGTTLRFYVNGVQVDTWTATNTPPPFGTDIRMQSTALGSVRVAHLSMHSAAISAVDLLALYTSASSSQYLVDQYVVAGSPAIIDYVGQRSTCDITLNIPSNMVNPYRPLEGLEVIVTDTLATPGDDRVFAGFIDTVDEDGEVASDGAGNLELLTMQLSCIDYTEFVDRHVVTADWDGVFSGEVVRDLVMDYLAGDGVTMPTGYVEDGPLVTRIVGNYSQLSQVLDDLSTRTGMSWFIDYYRRFHWFAAGSVDAPFSIVDPVNNAHRVKRKRRRTNYRNVQYIKGGTDTTDLRTESFKGDGTAKTYVVAFPVKTAPTITVNAVSKTVGVKGVDTNRQWYWTEGQAEVVQADSDAPWSVADIVAITYTGTFPVTVSAQLDAEIAMRAAREGSSGVYENVTSEPDIDRSDMAVERAEGFLRRFGTVFNEGTISTSSAIEPNAAKLRAGDVISIDVERRGLVGSMLVQTVHITPGSGGLTMYEFDVVSNESQGSWVDYFRRLATLAGAQEQTDGDTFVYVRRNAAIVKLTDTLSATSAVTATDAIVGIAIVGYSEIMH